MWDLLYQRSTQQQKTTKKYRDPEILKKEGGMGWGQAT